MLISGPILASTIAKACQSKRQALGLRQSDLAARCGISEATIMRFERTGQTTLALFTRLAVALGLAESLVAALEQSTAPTPARTAEEFLRGTQPRQRVRLPSRR